MPGEAVKALGGVPEAVRVREMVETRVKYSFWCKLSILNTMKVALVLVHSH
jgi:hypothetical protein